MALSFRQGMRLITEFQGLVKRDFPVSGITLAGNAGTAANPTLCDGEFLSLDTTSTTAQRLVRFSSTDGYQAVRGGAVAGDLILACGLWPVSTEVGRYDTQAIGKTTILFCGAFEAEFKMWDLGDQAQLTMGVPIGISSASNDWGNGAERRPCISTDAGLGTGAWRVGYITLPPAAATAGTVLRAYITCSPYTID